VIERYPIGASNHTYITFFSHPLSGIGVPHFKSLEMHLGFRPYFIQAAVVVIAFSVHYPFTWLFIVHSSNSFYNFGKFKKQCSVSLITGAVPHIAHYASTNVSGVSNFPHLSH